MKNKDSKVHVPQTDRYANRVLYDVDKQKQILRDVIHYIQMKNKMQERGFVKLAEMFLIDLIPFLKDPSLRDEEEYRLIIKVTDPNDKSATSKKKHLSSIERYREYNNMLFPYITLKMNDKIYVNKILVGYGYRQELSESLLMEYISTLGQYIDVEKIRFALRW